MSGLLALPAAIVLSYIVRIAGYAYGYLVAPKVIFTFIALGFLFVVAHALVGLRKSDSRLRMLNCLSSCILLIFYNYTYASAEDWALKYRVLNAPKFISCRNNAESVGDMGYYNVCEEKDLTLAAINNTFWQIVYDSTLMTEQKCRQTEGWRYATLYESDADYEVKKIIGNYYLVVKRYNQIRGEKECSNG